MNVYRLSDSTFLKSDGTSNFSINDIHIMYVRKLDLLVCCLDSELLFNSLLGFIDILISDCSDILLIRVYLRIAYCPSAVSLGRGLQCCRFRFCCKGDCKARLGLSEGIQSFTRHDR